MHRALVALAMLALAATPSWAQQLEITKVPADVMGNESLEELRLVGVRHASTGYYRRLALEVRQNGKLLTSIDLPDGYEPRLRLYDFTGDRRPEVWISSNSQEIQGCEGATRQTVIALNSGKAVPILDSRRPVIPRISGQFLDYYRASVTVEAPRLEEYVDLGENRTLYDKAGFYTDGILTKPTNLWSGNAYSGAKSIDPNGDGTYDLEVTQEIFGVTNTDRVACVTTRLSYREAQWVPVGSWITHLPKTAPIPRKSKAPA